MPYKFVVKKDKKGEFRWTFMAPNGEAMGTSGEGYTRKQSCLDAIASIKKNAPGAAVEEPA
jgi:uncharacterized protein YegP (UPF0339 family)